jgi:hypothetical protein
MGRIRVDMNPGSRYTTDPGVYTTNLAAWYRADAITGKVDADTLAVWPDSSGNNRDAVMSVVANRASSFFWKDGGAKATINTGAGADLTGLTLGAYVDGSLNWLGDLAEVMLLDEATSIANVNVNGQALANKYGLTWTTAT